MNIAHLFMYFVVFFVWYPYFVEMCHPAFRSCGNDCQYPVGVSESELGSEHRVLLNMHLMRAHLRYFIFVQCVVCCMYSGSAPFIYKYQSVRVKEEHSVLGSYMPARFTHICIINGWVEMDPAFENTTIFISGSVTPRTLSIQLRETDTHRQRHWKKANTQTSNPSFAYQLLLRFSTPHPITCRRISTNCPDVFLCASRARPSTKLKVWSKYFRNPLAGISHAKQTGIRNANTCRTEEQQPNESKQNSTAKASLRRRRTK